MAFMALNDWDPSFWPELRPAAFPFLCPLPVLYVFRFIHSTIAFFITWWSIPSPCDIPSSPSPTQPLLFQLNPSVISARKLSLILFPPVTQDYILSLHPDLLLPEARILVPREERQCLHYSLKTSTVSLACSRCWISFFFFFWMI